MIKDPYNRGIDAMRQAIGDDTPEHKLYVDRIEAYALEYEAIYNWFENRPNEDHPQCVKTLSEIADIIERIIWLKISGDALVSKATELGQYFYPESLAYLDWFAHSLAVEMGLKAKALEKVGITPQQQQTLDRTPWWDPDLFDEAPKP